MERRRGKQQRGHTRPSPSPAPLFVRESVVHGLRQRGYITGFKPLWNRSSHRAETGDGHREKYPSRFCPGPGLRPRSPSRKKSLLPTRAYFSTLATVSRSTHSRRLPPLIARDCPAELSRSFFSTVLTRYSVGSIRTIKRRLWRKDCSLIRSFHWDTFPFSRQALKRANVSFGTCARYKLYAI